MLTAIVFIVILGTLILVHELGHFVVARRNGVSAEEFGFGFPPRVIGTYKDKKGKRRWVFGNKEIEEEIKDREETVYSLNLIPLGGFVKITGQDGESKNDPKSFAAQSIWTRFKILFAGVGMNFVLAVVLFYLAFMFGLPEVVGDEVEDPNSKIQISLVASESPAKQAGLKMGDEVVSISDEQGEVEIRTVAQLQEMITKNKGNEIQVEVVHMGDDESVMIGVTPRKEMLEGEKPLGVALVRTAHVKHGQIDLMIMAVKTTWMIVVAIFAFLWDLILKLFTSEPVGAEVAGPIGIVIMTSQVTRMGLAFVLQFAALLSVNLAIINLLPIPALDGGRILFLAIEKLKGSPVSEKIEGTMHTIGFFFLIGLMVLVAVCDVANFEIVDKLKNIF